MKRTFLTLMALALSAALSYVWAYDIAVENAGGVKIYYNFISEGQELEVTYGSYSGEIVIPEEVTYQGTTRRVTRIGEQAFMYLTLTSVTIPGSVTSIGEYAFGYCYGLTSITIPGSVTSISNSSIHCRDLASIIVEKDNPVYDSRDNCNAIIETASNTLITGCKNSTIPNGVTSIGFHSFSYCSGLASITIPESVTSIGEWAFRGCSSLTSVTIPNGVTSIGNDAFFDCGNLASVAIPSSVTSIGSEVFGACESLTSITVEQGNPVYDSRDNCNAIIKTASNTLFAGCKNTTIPNSVTSLGRGAFYYCLGLTSITIPESVTNISFDAFAACKDLTSITVEKDNPIYDSRDNCNAIIESASNTLIAGCKNSTIPNSVTTIGYGSFYYCLGLTSITIPGNVTSIEPYAFRYCDNLKEIISFIENPFGIYGKSSNYACFDASAFGKVMLYVPQGTIDKYKATTGWQDFANIVEGAPTPEQCEKPTIGYKEGKLTFQCATEGATCVYNISDVDVKSGEGSEVNLGVTYVISVYAKKDGYLNSETATATLCWIDVEPEQEGITNAVGAVKAQSVLVQRTAGGITVEGAATGTPIAVYDLSGKLLGSALAADGVTRVEFGGRERLVVVRIGERSLKMGL